MIAFTHKINPMSLQNMNKHKWIYKHPGCQRQTHRIIASAVKTTFDFGDEEEFINSKKEAKKRQIKYQIDNLNKLFYSKCMNCCGNDLIQWMEQKWGKRYQMSLEKHHEELILKIHPYLGHGNDYCSSMDKIAGKLNDWMLMDYVKDTILSYTSIQNVRKEWGFFGKEILKEEIIIPLNIYYDGTI
jgi:hypothetical protein